MQHFLYIVYISISVSSRAQSGPRDFIHFRSTINHIRNPLTVILFPAYQFMFSRRARFSYNFLVLFMYSLVLLWKAKLNEFELGEIYFSKSVLKSSQ